MTASSAFTGGADGSKKFKPNLNSSNEVVARVYRTDNSYVELTSSAIPVDGATPTCVILTVDTLLKAGNIKLFIDGALVDQSGLRLAGATTNNWQTGSTMQSDDSFVILGNKVEAGESFAGRLEEIVIYKKCIYPVVPTDSEYIFRKPLREISNGSPLSHIGRLFIKDYHNIRGSTSDEIASSSPVSWRKAAFRLVD